MKVNELIYMVLDLSKAASSDDAFYTEDHVISLCKKYRAFLIKKEQDKNKGMEDTASVFEQQQICIDLERVPAMDGSPCTGGYYLRSTKPIPKLLEGYQPKVYPMDYFQGIHISFISNDRMRYIGTNPYLRNIIYTSIAPNKHLYINGNNQQFLYLRKLRMAAIFENFEDTKDLLCDDAGEKTPCDILDMDFPIREHLVPPLIELVVKELSGAKYQPQDTKNNANDDLPNKVKQ